MSKYYSREYAWNKIPLEAAENRTERIIVDVLGPIIPANDLIIYGLLGSPESENLQKLKRFTYNSDELFRDTCILSNADLLKWVDSPPGDKLNDMEPDRMFGLLNIAIGSYRYFPCHETMMRHTLISLLKYEFVESLTLVYPWELRPIDKAYLKQIIPAPYYPKIRAVSGNLLDIIKSTSNNVPDDESWYTTILSNSLDEINILIDNSKEFKVEASCFLLRNTSENLDFAEIPDPNNPGETILNINEIGTAETLAKIADVESNLPMNRQRFARYEAGLYTDMIPQFDEEGTAVLNILNNSDYYMQGE